MSSGFRTLLVAGLLILAGAQPALAQGTAVSVATDGTPGNAASFTPAISDGGRFVAFISVASNLVPGDTNGFADVFLRDRDTDNDGVFDEPTAVTTVRVSERAGIQANGPSQEPVITADGHYVFFASRASTLFAVGQPQLPFFEVFRWDRLNAEVVLVSQNDAGEPLNESSFAPAVTAEGSIAYFISYASNGPSSGIGSGGAIMRRAIDTGHLEIVSEPVNQTMPGVQRQLETLSASSNGDIAYAVVDRDPLSGTRLGGYTIIRTMLGGTTRTVAAVSPKLSRDGRVLTGLSSSGASPYAALRLYLPTSIERRVGAFGMGDAAGGSSSGRYFQADGALFVDFHFDSMVGLFLSNDPMAFDGLDRWLAFSRRSSDRQDVYAISTAAAFDNDADGLNDHWEMLFGLSTGSPGGATGDSGPAGDPDHDGVTNAEELARGTNPNGTQARFMAEGAANALFSTRYSIANAGTGEATASLRFDLGDGSGAVRAFRVPARSRVTVDAHAEGLDGQSFAARLDSSQPLVFDRLMSWGDAPYWGGHDQWGSHAETASASPSTSWFLAEGSTVSGFQLFYLMQNPQTTPTQATVRFLLPSDAPIVRIYTLPPQSRTTVFVNVVPGLQSTDVSADITATQPIAVERAMYRSTDGQVFALGHDAAAVAAPATTWIFAEAASNAFFDTYLLMANPGASPATVGVAYLRDTGGPVTRTYTIPAGARFSVFADDVPGLDGSSYGMRVTSDVPVIAERAMYWAGGFFDYYEGHVSAGATQTGSHWVLAEGEEFGVNVAHTFVLIANTSSTPTSVRITTLPETGASEASDVLPIAGNARLTFPMSLLRSFQRGGIDVIEQGTPTGGLVVEGSIYWNAPGQAFGAGANWPATRIP